MPAHTLDAPDVAEHGVSSVLLLQSYPFRDCVSGVLVGRIELTAVPDISILPFYVLRHELTYGGGIGK